MAYVIPRAEITQQFTAIPVFTSSPLPALILGPNYKLSRYAIAAEKANTKLKHSDSAKANIYQSDSNVTYSYPSGDTAVDASYVKLFVEGAEVQVFPNTVLSNPSNAVTKVSGHTNRIISGAVNLKTANNTSRDSALSNRDVQVGDVVVVTDATSNTVLTTKVKSLIATVTGAIIGNATADTSNTGDDGANHITTGGTYTGAENLTYTITIDRGGAFCTANNVATCARAKITSNGVDSSATVNITNNTFFSVGTFGVTAKFTDDGPDNQFVAGDKFYIQVTAAAPSTVRTIELEDNLPSAHQDAAAALTMSIRLVKSVPVEIPRIRSLEANTVNWVAGNASFEVKSDITLTDPLIVNGSATVDLPVKGGKLFVQHRSLVTSLSGAIDSVTSAGQVTSKLGPVHPDNPLAQGVYDAVVNAASTVVYFGAVPSNNLTGYNAILELARKNNKYYSMVPLTFDPDVQNAVIGHVDAMSSASEAKWRIAWLAKPFTTTKLIYNLKSNNTNWTATVADDSVVTGTQYTLVTIDGASLITDGVRPGDTLLINFRLDSNGDTIYNEYEVESVRSQTQLLLTNGLDAAVNNAIKVQIRRNYTVAEQVADYAAIAGEFNNRRVRCVFPDTFFAGTQLKDGYYLAASLAGLRSGVVPHQGLTNIQVLGPTELPRVVNDLTEDQLNTLAEAGVWIVTQSALGATPYTRHQLTTDETGLNFAEDSITTNVDSISYALQTKIAPFIGLYNVNPGTVLQVRAAVDAELAYRATNTWTARTGNQLNGYVIDKVEQNASFKDRIDVQVTLQVPAPVNTIKLNLTV